MAVVITGSNTPTAGGVTYGDGTTYANTAAGTSGQALVSAGASAPAFGTLGIAGGGTNSTATPTAGTIPYGTGTALAYTAAGTSGQVLQSNAASAPTWVTPSSGAMVFLSSVTASASATVSIETGFSSTYDTYMLVASDVLLATDNGVLGMRLKIGGTYLSGGNYNAYAIQCTSDSVTFVGIADAGASRVRVTSDQGAGAGEVANLSMYFGPTSGTTNYKQFYWTGVFANSNGAPGAAIALTHGSGAVTGNTGALTGVRFLADTGNITSGTFRLYGIVKS
jgi:hypothetical protein